MRSLVRPVVPLLLALVGCEENPPTEQQPMLAMPTIADVLPSNTSDKSCECLLRGNCAMVADAVPGSWEGRNLQCRVQDARGRIVRCRFEARFVEGWTPQQERPGPWGWQDSLFHNSAPGAWRAGTG